jgi:hypothetical protein
MGPLEKEIAAYITATLARIAAPWTSAADLKSWWFSQREKDMRASLVITGTTPEHRQLYNAFMARGNALATASHIRGGAE